ncbi:hypothetical protein COUCH_09710 [Couchioplanes caeruleus]|uniref:hypothetical protein n=1 Tax=Couchioplanes caeruleus TaxID=56438 RepID=UPI0020BD5BE5|nr:hypothetical protein [Couchioplanes caeruleus]UQU66510.1 hypothetical protein COUCH_09710 [Couchioplanes caeruleus]
MTARPIVPTVLVLAAAMTALTGCGGSAEPAATPGASGAPGAVAGLGGTGADKADEAAAAGVTTEDVVKPKAPKAPATAEPRPEGPRIVSFTVVQKPKCAQALPLIISWKITGADSGALSVDDPTGTPGTYGPVSRHGSQEFPFSCGGGAGTIETHTYALYTVGGGPQKHKTLTVSAKVLGHGTPVSAEPS